MCHRLTHQISSILILAGLLLSLAQLGGVSTGLARTVFPPPAGPASDENSGAKVESLVFESLETAGQTDFFIWMTEKSDLSQAARPETKAEKGQWVFETLRSTAERTQKAMRAYLDRKGIEYQPFYISNKILSAGSYASGFCSWSTMVISNSIIWGNDICTNPYVGCVNPTISYSDVQGGWGGAGNLNADPLLAPLGDYGSSIQSRALLSGD